VTRACLSLFVWPCFISCTIDTCQVLRICCQSTRAAFLSVDKRLGGMLGLACTFSITNAGGQYRSIEGNERLSACQVFARPLSINAGGHHWRKGSSS
jgi:hypothetical protein